MPVEACSPSLACDKEEVCLQDKEETTSDASWTAVKKETRGVVWSRRVKWRRPEAAVLWNEVEGVSVNAEGEAATSMYGQK